MKKRSAFNIKKLIILSFLILFIGCNIEEENYLDLSNQAGETLITKAEAMELAQGELDTYSPKTGNWTQMSKVTDAFPIYIEGYTSPSYYECKIMTGMTPSGYILINVDATDLLLVEAMDEGLTQTESYGVELKRATSDLKVYRYGYFKSLATAKILDPTQKTSTQLLSQRGFSSNDEIELYSKEMSAKETTPFYTRKDLALQQEALFTTARRSHADEVTATLKNTTPRWRQHWRPVRDKDYPVGCGPVAWAMTLAYFQRYHGKTNFLPGLTVSAHWDKLPYAGSTDRDQVISRELDYEMIVNRLADDLHTQYGGNVGTSIPPYGLVGASNMRYVTRFLADRGYTVGYDRSATALYGKFKKVIASLNANKPVVMAIHSNGIGVIDHYVVIEKAAKNRGHFVRYYVNTGNGYYKWIYARGDDEDDNVVTDGYRHSIYDIWILYF